LVEAQKNRHLAVGSSAGGIETIRTPVSTLPEGFAPRQGRQRKVCRRRDERFLKPNTSLVPAPRPRAAR
jgi:hypothetical protein